MILQQLGVLALAVIFSIVCVEWNEKKAKNKEKLKTKSKVKNSGAP
jgi:hypothetical protein